MQGQRSAVGSLPEVLGFEHGSTSSDSSLEQPVRWNSLRSTSQNRIPDYMMSSDSSVGFLNAVNQPSQIQGEWDFGESSSRVRQVEVSGNDQKTELGWPTPVNVSTGAAVNSDGHRYGSSGLLSMNNAGLNMRGSGNNNGAFFVQSSGSETIPQDLNMNSEFIADEDDDDDDCQVLSPSAFKSGVSANERMPSASSSMSGGYAVEEGDGRRSSCKRKAIEGQSSGSGSSSYTQHAEGSLWHSISARRTVPRSLSIGASAENSSGITLPEPVNSRLGLSVGPENSPVRTVPSSAETTRRNLRLRIASQTQELRNSLLSRDNNVGSSSISSVHPSFRTLPRNNSLEHGLSPTIIDNGQPQGTPAVGHLLSARRNSLSRWQGPSSGTRSGSLAALGISGESEALFESAATSASVPRNLSEHPMFVPPPSEIRSSSQNSTNWNLAGGNVNNPVHVASAPRNSDPSVGAPSSALPWTASRNPPHFPRRLSEYVRRAASLSAADTEALGQSSNYTSLRSVPSASASASASQDTSLPPGPSNPGRHASSSRAMLLERHLDGAFGVPFSLRALAGAPEGRSRLMSEQIRNVLDLMRRGEGLRFEDVMILDQSVFLGMADLHDRHRDMRLDVDNMSYEELLALEERIGNVNTGLTEEVILKQLKKRTHTHNTREDIEREPCCVCQEEYIEGVELGALDCGHDFHAECIKQWLSHKNLCPICKTTGLSKAT